MSSGLIPIEPPSARLYLVQRVERLRLAIREIQADISLVEARFREINHSLILVVAALDLLDDERNEAGIPTGPATNESNNSQEENLP